MLPLQLRDVEKLELPALVVSGATLADQHVTSAILGATTSSVPLVAEWRSGIFGLLRAGSSPLTGQFAKRVHHPFAAAGWLF